MSKFIQLSVLTGLLGLASTLVACGDSEMTTDEAAKASPEDICERMAKHADDEPTDDEMKECKEGVSELKDALGDKWPETAECLANAKSEDDAESCAMKAMGAMMEQAGEEIEKELEKAEKDLEALEAK